MNTIVTKDFQIKLIAFGLLIIIPVTIDLGLKFMFPKTDWKIYQQLENEYVEKNMPHYDQYKKIKRDYSVSKKEKNLISVHTEYVKKWEESEQYKNLKKQDEKNNKYHFITLCFLIIVIISTSIFIHIPIINAATTLAALFLVTVNLHE